ncbi:sulfatase-like hydrolase/transferase [Halapricum desulfuricans]|nr:sulfatase-like hydrolase/transferase [Halapricum desulfuricans]
MDVLWIVLDSLSFEATPWAQDGPDTMPLLEDLASEQGTVFTNAYSPGPTSPSSHSSFFTGELPSQTGMHEANPYLKEDIRTIEDFLEHESLAISSNPFVFNGLCKNFDHTDDLRDRGFMIFEDASDPITDFDDYGGDSNIIGSILEGIGFENSVIEEYLNFVLSDGKPIRSLANGLSFKINGSEMAPEDGQHRFARTITNHVREFMKRDPDIFTFANYMDAHAPLNISEEALNEFSPTKSIDELPIGVRGQTVHESTDTGLSEQMFDLYKAVIWDLDRIITPLVRDAVESGSFVVITADHGNWFRRDRELDEERIHVPLVIFSPYREPGEIEETVNLRSLPKTTADELGIDNDFDGYNLLDVSEDKLSVTELIHDPSNPGSPVEPFGQSNQSIRHDIAVVKGDSRMDYVDGFKKVRGDLDEELKDHIRKIRSEDVTFEPTNDSADSDRKDRLRQLGYLE